MTVYFVGDSTVCEYGDEPDRLIPRNGYGMRVKEYLKNVKTVNLALGGRSSRSFLKEDNYQVLCDSIAAGDYLVIGFGHNDQKRDDRFTNPNLGTSDQGGFKNYLYEYYIKLAFNRGATPILCTPIGRLRDDFDYSGVGGHVTRTFEAFVGGNYPRAIKELAKEKGVTLVDMTALTVKLYLSLPLDTAKRLFSTNSLDENDVDHTHINQKGAKYMAYLFCDALLSTDCDLKEYVNQEKLIPPEF